MNITQISNITPGTALKPTESNPVSKTEKSFSDFFSSSIDEVNNAQIEGDLAIKKIHSGEAQNLHDVMISVEKAEISLKMLVQIRNKALTAYNEIMRMQV